MNPYYQTMLQELNGQVESGFHAQALARIQEELRVPYVPQDVLRQLEELETVCRRHLFVPASPDAAKLDVWISGTDVQKEMAVTMLCGLNLRQYPAQIQKLLDSALLQEFKGQLIEAMMEQRIDDAFHIVKDGLDIDFIPSAITPTDQDPVLAGARQYFEDWFSAGDGTLLTFCQRILEQEILDMRPFDFVETDARDLAAAVARVVFDAMSMQEQWADFAAAQNLQKTGQYILSIERQGETQ